MLGVNTCIVLLHTHTSTTVQTHWRSQCIYARNQGHLVNSSRNSSTQQARRKREGTACTAKRTVRGASLLKHITTSISSNLVRSVCRRYFKKCQEKHSCDASDMSASCKVTEDCFQMKPASLRRHSENRNTETKLFSISQLHSWFWMRYMGQQMKVPIKDVSLSRHHILNHKFQEINTSSGHSAFNISVAAMVTLGSGGQA